MPFVRRYQDLNTNLDALYKSIKKELQNNKELNIASELSGDVNGVPFKSVTASRASIPRVFVGGLREVTITITGKPEDYLIELHTGAWLSNMLVPGTGALLIAGPFAGAAAAGATGLYAVNYQRTLKNKIKDLVKKHSTKEYTADKVETFSQS
jgi:hypothetical protein